jgi:hypothetical protein
MDIAALARYEATDLDHTIDPADQMWNTGLDWYWGVGRSGLECVPTLLALVVIGGFLFRALWWPRPQGSPSVGK